MDRPIPRSRTVHLTVMPSEFRLRLEARFDAWALPRELAAEIEDRCSWVTYERGTVIFASGARANAVFWVAKGMVKAYLPLANGGRSLVFVARCGEPLGIIDRVDDYGRRHHVLDGHALTRCTVGLLGREQLATLLHKLDCKTAVKLLENLNTMWSAIFERFAGLIGLSLRERLEMVFKDLAARFGVKDDRGVLIMPKLSQEELAEMIGSSRPMISKLLADMAQEGLLARGEHRLILRKDTVSTNRNLISPRLADQGLP